MRLLGLFLTLGLLAAGACTPAPQTALPMPPTATTAPLPTPKPTADQAALWREDLQALARAMPVGHPNLFWRVSEAEFQAAVADLDARIPELTDEAVIVELSRIVSFADGHSFIPLFQSAVAFHLYPLRLYWFSDGLYVEEACEPL